MNLIILESVDDLRLSKEQSEHVRLVLKSKAGDTLRVGILNGGCGKAEVVSVEKNCVVVKLLDSREDMMKPPSRDTKVIDVLLGIPRPRVLERTLQTLATLGVGRIFLVASSRSDKSYLNSPKLKPEALRGYLKAGLEQSGVDTLLPELYVYASWGRAMRELGGRGFLPESVKLLVAHPYEDGLKKWSPTLENLSTHPAGIVLAIGPEGGFIPSELADLEGLGGSGFGLGGRILKVEQALIAAHQLATFFLTQVGGRVPATRQHSLGHGGVQLPERDWKAQLQNLQDDWKVERDAKIQKLDSK